MPFWLAAPLSAMIFTLGLVGVLWHSSPLRRAMGVMLMLQGGLVLFMVTAVQYQQFDGWAAALLVLALLPAEYAVGRMGRRRLQSRDRDTE